MKEPILFTVVLLINFVMKVDQSTDMNNDDLSDLEIGIPLVHPLSKTVCITLSDKRFAAKKQEKIGVIERFFQEANLYLFDHFRTCVPGGVLLNIFCMWFSVMR